jgi:hypothetical protein
MRFVMEYANEAIRPASRVEKGRFFVLKLMVVLAALAAAPAGHAAEAAVSGMIRICRVPGEGATHRGKAIEIPAGAAFGDTGVVDGPGGGGRYWPLWIETTEPTTIAPADACGAAKARITGNMDRHRLRAADRRLFVPSGVVAGGKRTEWPGDLSLTATATADFK